MSELSEKLHYKQNNIIDEISLYTTLDEVQGNGVPIKINGINCYAGYGLDGDISRMSYKKNSTTYKVLKKAVPMGNVSLKAYRNNDTLFQTLPSMSVEIGQKFYLNNKNAPTISGYDFVCAVPNNFIVQQDSTVKVYYVPSTVADRTLKDWNFKFRDASGDLSKTDAANTFSATNMANMFNGSSVTKLPKINTSNVTNMNAMFYYCDKLLEIKLEYFDTSKVTDMSYMFNRCMLVTSLDMTNFDTSKVTDMSAMLYMCSSLTTIKGALDLSSCKNVVFMFNGSSKLRNVHLKNVPRSLDFSNSGGTEGTHYIIDNYID